MIVLFEMVADPHSRRADRALRFVVVFGFALVFAGAAVAIGLIGYLLDADMRGTGLAIQGSKHWVPTPTTQVDVRAWFFEGIWNTSATYHYRVAGREYVSERVAFVDPAGTMDEDAVPKKFRTKDIKDFPICWVDPADPTQAVLVQSAPINYRWRRYLVVAAMLSLPFALLAVWLARRALSG